MPFCNSRDFTIDMNRDSDGVLIDTLFFHLIINGGVIDPGRSTMTPSIGTGPTPVLGRCRSVNNPDVSVVNMVFNWDTVQVFMAGVIFRDPADQLVKFLGRFHAFTPAHPIATKSAHKTATPARDSGGATADASALAGPSDGDTGTGTGQQT